MSFPLLASLFSAGSAVIGAALCYIHLDARNRRSRVALAREMTRQVRARYEAYVTIEGRVTRVIRDFDRAETTLQSKLADQTRQMLRLHQALDAHEGVTTTFEQRQPVVTSNAPLGALVGEGVEEVAAFEDELDSWHRAPRIPRPTTRRSSSVRPRSSTGSRLASNPSIRRSWLSG